MWGRTKKGKSFHDYKNDLRTFTADISVLKHVEEVFIDQLMTFSYGPLPIINGCNWL
jgi:aspartate carbamoyltransferase catalytic subunit